MKDRTSGIGEFTVLWPEIWVEKEDLRKFRDETVHEERSERWEWD